MDEFTYLYSFKSFYFLTYNTHFRLIHWFAKRTAARRKQSFFSEKCDKCVWYFMYKHSKSSKKITSSQQMCKTQTGEYVAGSFCCVPSSFCTVICTHMCCYSSCSLRAGMRVFVSDREERKKVYNLKKTIRVHFTIPRYFKTERDRISSIVIVWFCVRISYLDVRVCVCACVCVWICVYMRVPSDERFDHHSYIFGLFYGDA